MTYPFLDHDGPIAFAHRGASDEHADNSWDSFFAAVDLGYRYLETDVRATSDGVVLTSHDDAIDLGDGEMLSIRDNDHAHITNVLARHGRPAIPRIDELLERFPAARLNIDIKHGSATRPLVDTLRRCDALDRVCVASFSDKRIADERRELGSELCTAAGPTGIVLLRVASLLRGAARSIAMRPISAAAVQVPVQLAGLTLVDERLIATAHEFGLVVHVWTINERREMERLLDLGVDGIMSDRSDILRAVLEERGQWESS